MTVSRTAAVIPLPLSKAAARRATRWTLVSSAPAAVGGLIAVGGPPLGGKSVLAARLAECLPNAIRLEAIDDLSRDQPYWIPDATHRRVARDCTGALLLYAKQLWRSAPSSRPPILLVVTRFGTAAERRRAKVAARLGDMPFLFVEARSRDERALRQIPRAFLGPEELEARLTRYRRSSRAYRPIGRLEELILPALRLRRVHSQLDDAVDRVLTAWRAS